MGRDLVIFKGVHLSNMNMSLIIHFTPITSTSHSEFLVSLLTKYNLYDNRYK